MLKNNDSSNQKLFFEALWDTFPVFAAYFPIGIIWGVLWEQTGLPPIWAVIYNFTIFAGAVQFLALAFLTEGGSPWLLFFTALPISMRNSFYTVAFMHRLPKQRWFKIYSCFALVDTTFAILTNKSEDITRNPWYTLPLSAAIHFYWVAGAAVGVWIGVYIPQSFTSINFALPALILVLAIEQYKKIKHFRPIIIALVSGGISWIVIGHHWFLSAIAICSMITIFQPLPINKNNENLKKQYK